MDMLQMRQMGGGGGGLARSGGQLVRAVVVSKVTEMVMDNVLEKNDDNPLAVLGLITKENVGRLEVAGGVAAVAAGQTDGWASMGCEILAETAAITSGVMRSFIKMGERAEAAKAAKTKDSNKEEE